MIDIGGLADQSSVARSLNGKGEIVGYSGDFVVNWRIIRRPG